jgi:predicted RNA-binding protein associated with RNAse of E/G family
VSGTGGKERTDAVWRDVHRGRVWRAQACRVVEDSGEWIALWMPHGSPTYLPSDHEGRRIRIPVGNWELEPANSTRDTLALARPGRAHSIYLFWDEGSFDHWYVNFEQPLRRTLIGFDTFDEKLDLIVRPDGTYEWKDEDELEHAAALGLLEADAVRAEAARVLEDWPFPTGWEGWQPNPAWPVPRLPGGWDDV